MGADTDKPKTIDYTLIAQAATLPGDPWLCADSVAVLLGMFTSDGRPNRRGITEGLARKSSFPAPLVLNNERKWRRSEVVRWAEDEQRIQQAA